MSRATRRANTEKRRKASIKWAARYHNQIITLDGESGLWVALAYKDGNWGKLRLVREESGEVLDRLAGRASDARDFSYKIPGHKFTLAPVSQAVLARLRSGGEVKELDPEIAVQAKFWDRRVK